MIKFYFLSLIFSNRKSKFIVSTSVLNESLNKILSAIEILSRRMDHIENCIQNGNHIENDIDSIELELDDYSLNNFDSMKKFFLNEDTPFKPRSHKIGQ